MAKRLNYKVPVECLNCAHRYEIKIPLGLPFLHAKRENGKLSLSGYYNMPNNTPSSEAEEILNRINSKPADLYKAVNCPNCHLPYLGLRRET